jgi:hypothetical protein
MPADGRWDLIQCLKGQRRKRITTKTINHFNCYILGTKCIQLREMTTNINKAVHAARDVVIDKIETKLHKQI